MSRPPTGNSCREETSYHCAAGKVQLGNIRLSCGLVFFSVFAVPNWFNSVQVQKNGFSRMQVKKRSRLVLYVADE